MEKSQGGTHAALDGAGEDASLSVAAPRNQPCLEEGALNRDASVDAIPAVAGVEAGAEIATGQRDVVAAGAAGDVDGGDDAEADADEAVRRLESVELSSPAVVQRVAERLQGYRLPPESLKALRETLNDFVGTKNYHNYTNHKQPTDPSCQRRVYHLLF